MAGQLKHLLAARDFSSALGRRLSLKEVGRSEDHVLFKVGLGRESDRRGNFLAVAGVVNALRERHDVNAAIAPSSEKGEAVLESRMQFMPEKYPSAAVLLARKPFSR